MESSMESSTEESDSYWDDTTSNEDDDLDSEWNYMSWNDYQSARSEYSEEDPPDASGTAQLHKSAEAQPHRESVPTNVPSSSTAAGLDEEEGALCNICLSAWTNLGPHRICALKCGHLFGHKCLERWLLSKTTCPTCKAKVSKTNIWFICANKLLKPDPTELVDVKRKLELAVQGRDKIASELAESREKENQMKEQMAAWNERLRLQSKESQQRSSRTQCRTGPFLMHMDTSLGMSGEGGCRVLATNSSLDLMVASMKSPSNMNTGHGIMAVSISSYKQSSYIPLHSQLIRGLCLHPQRQLVLTAAEDRGIRIVETSSNTVLARVTCHAPLWSCCWDDDTGVHFYCGTQVGTVEQYDIRNPGLPVISFQEPSDMSPVISVAKIPNVPGHQSLGSGIVTCKLNSMWFFENNPTSTRHRLPLAGPFSSMKYQRQTNQLLVSTRPSPHCHDVRHNVCTLEKDVAQINCKVVQSFSGGEKQTFLSKSAFISKNGNDYVAAFRESDYCVHLWSVNTGEKLAVAASCDVVMDLGGATNTSNTHLVCLTRKRLNLFKFDQS